MMTGPRTARIESSTFHQENHPNTTPTHITTIMSLLSKAWEAITDPHSTRWTAPLQLAGDAILCVLIIYTIPCKTQILTSNIHTNQYSNLFTDTEIDWRTYMQQIHLYIHGERDYAKLTGDTGPLVYPAAHVYIYRLLYSLTNAGQNIALAQWIFVGLYLLTLWTVMQCYRTANVPPWVFPLLSLSKRAHSIFMLRLFNDCFAVLFLFGAIALWQRRLWTTGTLVYSFGVGVKMSLLLALPAVGVVLWQGMGRDRAFYQAQAIGQLQVSEIIDGLGRVC